MKPEKDRSQSSFLEGNDFEYFYFVTNTEADSEKVVVAYEKRGNAENYISTPKGHKEAKYDMAVGRLLIKSFWANEAIFQVMMLSFNLFLLFKFDFLGISEFHQQITYACGTGAGKTFLLKIFFWQRKLLERQDM